MHQKFIMFYDDQYIVDDYSNNISIVIYSYVLLNITIVDLFSVLMLTCAAHLAECSKLFVNEC
jgi:hypothetical protein